MNTDTLYKRIQRIERGEDGLELVFCEPEEFTPGPNKIRLDPEDRDL